MAAELDIYLGSIVRKWKSSCADAGQVKIVSPYITSRTAEIVTSSLSSGQCEIYTLFNAEVFVSSSSSVQTLINLKKKGFRIFSVEHLHAKVILTSNNVLTIGSQNLTNRGGKNIEATVITTDEKIIRKVESWLADLSEVSNEISDAMLEEMRSLIKPHLKRYKELREELSQIDLQIAESEKQRVVEAEKNRKKQEKIKRQKREIIKQIKSRHSWIGSWDVPLELAERFVKASAWWHGHKSGSPVRAPKHYERIKKSNHGWYVTFGGNQFLVGKAIRRCGFDIDSQIQRIFKGESVSYDELKTELKRTISGCVANDKGYEYNNYYPVTDGDMMFGNQSIDVNDGASFLIESSGIRSILD